MGIVIIIRPFSSDERELHATLVAGLRSVPLIGGFRSLWEVSMSES